MRQMKDSGIEWIGGIPENWNVIRIHNIFQRRIEKNQPIKSKERLSLSIEKGVTLYSEKTTNLDRFKDDFTQYQIAYPNDIILNSMNMIVGAVGKSNYFGCVSPVYYVIYGRKDNNVDSEYYSYLLNIPTIRKIYYKLGQGIYAIDRGDGRVNTCRLKVNYVDFRNIVVPIPPISEQRKISTYINMKCGEVDSMIALQEEMISELQAYKQSVITEAVTHGLNPNVKMKDSGIEWIGDIPEKWKVLRIKDLFSFRRGLNITKANLVTYGLPVISYGQIHSKYNSGVSISNELLRYVPQEYSMYVESLMQKDYFIFADTSEDLEGCGNCAFLADQVEIFGGYHCLILRPRKDNIFYKYLAYLFKSDCWRSQIRSRVSGIKVYSISQGILSKCSLILPQLAEQQAIATYLDTKCSDIDRLISLKQEKIESLKAYKQSIIYEYVTGKLSVRC